jgi:hypothetical protein
VNGDATYFVRIFFASARTASAMALRASSMAAMSARSSASCNRCHSSSGNLESIGSQQGCESLRPGKRTANSTRKLLPGTVLHVRPRIAAASVLRQGAPRRCTSPHVPRVFTLPSTRFKSPTPTASDCISPSPRCTCSRRSDTRRRRFAEALLERSLELLVDGRAHLLELGRVVGAHDVEAMLDRRAHGLERGGELAAQAVAHWPCSVRALARSWRMSRSDVRDLRDDGIEARAQLDASRSDSRVSCSRPRAIAPVRTTSIAISAAITTSTAHDAKNQSRASSQSSRRLGRATAGSRVSASVANVASQCAPDVLALASPCIPASRWRAADARKRGAARVACRQRARDSLHAPCPRQVEAVQMQI